MRIQLYIFSFRNDERELTLLLCLMRKVLEVWAAGLDEGGPSFLVSGVTWTNRPRREIRKCLHI